MSHEELALRRNKARNMAGDGSDQMVQIDRVEISEPEFAKRARQLEIYHLKNFYDSRSFAVQNFHYDPSRKVIIQKF